MDQAQATAGTRIVLHFGPKEGTTQFHHLYFATYDEGYTKTVKPESGRDLIQHPQDLAVPLGTVLSFHWLSVRSHDVQGMGTSNSIPTDHIKRVIYTTRDGRVGLLLPQWTKTLHYEGFEPLVTEGPEYFLPFSGEPHVTKVTGGGAHIVSLPVSTVPA